MTVSTLSTLSTLSPKNAQGIAGHIKRIKNDTEIAYSYDQGDTHTDMSHMLEDGSMVIHTIDHTTGDEQETVIPAWAVAGLRELVNRPDATVRNAHD
jgi:hypothetical protein